MTVSRFGIAVAPTFDVEGHYRLAALAEAAGLDLIGIQDHPYVAKYVDAFTLISQILARTQRITLFPDVANLPLRPATMLARTASSLARVSGGRFALGLGAGGYWDAIATMGVPRLGSAEALKSLDEGIRVMRELWQPGHTIASGLAGQGPAVPIWVGSVGPRSLRLTGRLADGWAAPIPSYLPYEQWGPSNRIIDAAAAGAGRSTGDVTRMAQIVGTITPAAGEKVELVGDAPIRTDVNGWVDALGRLADDYPFTTFVFWPERADEDQIRRFGEELAPALREQA
jgi:alkanesulfonate monooxygenase SsuD/methylene tetrahydromethanopterin reductase-like flavin-dependent oxidoreductase (luciferase family)